VGYEKLTTKKAQFWRTQNQREKQEKIRSDQDKSLWEEKGGVGETGAFRNDQTCIVTLRKKVEHQKKGDNSQSTFLGVD